MYVHFTRHVPATHPHVAWEVSGGVCWKRPGPAHSTLAALRGPLLKATVLTQPRLEPLPVPQGPLSHWAGLGRAPAPSASNRAPMSWPTLCTGLSFKSGPGSGWGLPGTQAWVALASPGAHVSVAASSRAVAPS